MLGHRDDRRERAASALGVALVHALIGWALLTGLGFEPVRQAEETLAAFDVTEPPPPPEARPAPEKAAARAEGAAAPPALEARPSPIVAPPPVVPTPSPVIAAPVASPDDAPISGATPLPGPGTGGGGMGTGTGSGGAGDGPGGGGGAVRAKQIAGAITPRDYPAGARRAGARGSVTVRFTVGTDGRARDCAVAISSGRSDLDATTCRLIEARFRYRPARDAAGRAVAEERGWRQDWWFE
ncbi:TonB family protein [Sphingomonas gilva]|uniref:TonB family protein n=1 Tax=Sphingomonas gilva TaxID=2305907 RepID=A0A396RQ84_9SPHN|nr:TonB family protein [Sphingomonas gilva]RHW18539.1 TonB family protein [Sphingomonas gilva]